MKTLLFICIAFMLVFINGCKKDGTVYVAQYLDIAYNDNLGNDLLDPSNSNGFSSENIQLYTLVNNVKTEVYHPNLTYAHSFMIYKNDSLKLYFLRVFLEDNTTFLQLNQNITDTITCTIDKSNGNSIIRKVWYNGDIKWEFGKVAPCITIKK